MEKHIDLAIYLETQDLPSGWDDNVSSGRTSLINRKIAFHGGYSQIETRLYSRSNLSPDVAVGLAIGAYVSDAKSAAETFAVTVRYIQDLGWTYEKITDWFLGLRHQIRMEGGVDVITLNNSGDGTSGESIVLDAGSNEYLKAYLRIVSLKYGCVSMKCSDVMSREDVISMHIHALDAMLKYISNRESGDFNSLKEVSLNLFTPNLSEEKSKSVESLRGSLATIKRNVEVLENKTGELRVLEGGLAIESVGSSLLLYTIMIFIAFGFIGKMERFRMWISVGAVVISSYAVFRIIASRN